MGSAGVCSGLECGSVTQRRLWIKLCGTKNAFNMYNEESDDEKLLLAHHIQELLSADGLEWDKDALRRMALHLALVRKWNDYASLVSARDVSKLLTTHLPDSLSLASIVSRCGAPLVDIGSGGGFPAIPLKCMLPSLPVVLIERSAKKAGFLRKVIGALGLKDVKLVQGSFPLDAHGLAAGSVTARAVERPAEILASMRDWLPDGTNFLCQSGDPGPALGDGFHVEQISDRWESEGLRRGTLHVVRRIVQG